MFGVIQKRTGVSTALGRIDHGIIGIEMHDWTYNYCVYCRLCSSRRPIFVNPEQKWGDYWGVATAQAFMSSMEDCSTFAGCILFAHPNVSHGFDSTPYLSSTALTTMLQSQAEFAEADMYIHFLVFVYNSVAY